MKRKVGVAVVALLAACAPQAQEATAKGDYVVTTWSRAFGLAATKRNNEEAARETCPDGYILLGETIGRDEDGNFRRWEYGCLTR